MLPPSPLTCDVFLFALAIAAERWGVLVHACCVLSNHYHLVVTDPGGRLPKFAQHLNSVVARAMNRSMNRSENFWASGTYSAVRLVGAEDVVEKTAYALANPAAAGLVSTGRDWQGLWLHPDRIGADALEIKRPEKFFAPDGETPAVARLQLTTPPGFTSATEFVEHVNAALARHEEEARAQGGGKIPDAAEILAVDPSDRPKTFEPRRRLNPHIAARDRSKRVEALRALKQFRRDHREARSEWLSGRRDVVFPVGTYLFRVVYGVACATATG